MTVMERIPVATPSTRRHGLFERVYGVTVALKGFDGAVELIAGLLLLVAPGAIRWGLQGGAAEAKEQLTPLRGFVAAELLQADHLVAAGVGVLAIVLLVHGVVKLVTVYCLLRRIVVAYPWAVLALVVLLVWQVVVFAADRTPGSAVLVVLDVVVLAVVAREWRLLVVERRSRNSAEED